MGPNPVGGVRFFGIGNELEATVVALVPIATGAALAAWAPRISPRGAALAFALTRPGRRRRVRAGAVRRRRRRRDRDPDRSGRGGGRLPRGPRRRWLLLVIAAPIVALAALGAADLAAGRQRAPDPLGPARPAGSTSSPTSPSAACGSRPETSAATPARRCCGSPRSRSSPGSRSGAGSRPGSRDRRAAWAGLVGAAAATAGRDAGQRLGGAVADDRHGALSR